MIVVQAYRSMSRQAVEILIAHERNGRMDIAAPVNLTFHAHDEGACCEPTLALPFEAAQQLMQALWDQGYRPNNGEGSAGQVAALKAHIQFAERVSDRLMAAVTVNDSQQT